MLKLIKYDMFGVVNRIKHIDSNYFIFYNTHKKCYELYYKKGFNFTLELTLAKQCLTFLDYKKVWLTRVVNLKTIMKEIEQQNEKNQVKNNALLKDELISKTKTLLRVGG